MLLKEKFQSYKLYACPEAKISPLVMISDVSQHVISFTCHNESMLIGLFRQRQFADERKWLFVSADVRGAGTRDEPLRTSAWEATFLSVHGDLLTFILTKKKLNENQHRTPGKTNVVCVF